MLVRMRRSNAVTYGILGAVALLALGTYYANPYHTPSQDWRARIVGFTIYRCPSRSMEPTVKFGDIFAVNVATLRARDPRIGEIIIFKYPPNPDVAYIKRVVATGGSAVELRAGYLFVDGKPINEPYITAAARAGDSGGDFSAFVVPAGSFFVLGDNRHDSADSRIFGPVPRELVIGTYARFPGT